MKRNVKLVYEILAFAENYNGESKLIDFKIDGYSKEEIDFHIAILVEAGYLRRIETKLNGIQTSGITRLTWEGFNYLDKFR